jgi:peroxiredoxin
VDQLVVAAGDRAPDFKLPAIDGREVSLAELRHTGPVLVLFAREFS